MSDLFKDFTGVVMAIIGVAIIYVLVSGRNNTSQVASTVLDGTSNLLFTAMGGAPAQSYGTAGG